MLKEALEYLISLRKPEVIEIDGQKYTTDSLYHVTHPSPEAIEITTLSGLVDYIKVNVDELDRNNLMIHVCSPKTVKLYSALKEDAERDCFVVCNALTPDISFNCFCDTEKFIIMLQSCFVPNDDLVALLKVVGNIKEENVRQVGDDGISQEVTIKAGIARVANVIVPNPVKLAPYRTFPEVEQPVSKFVFRMQDGPRCALFEADGGMWRNHAMKNIKEYLKAELRDWNIKIIS